MNNIDELLKRQYHSGSRVINCITHQSISLLERPDNCKLCLSDIKNQLSYAISVNEWLNIWKDDAVFILQEVSRKNAQSME